MRAEIISIGTELLLGSILNTNARFLSQRLAEQAIDVYHRTTVGDNVDRIVQSLKDACGRSDLLITSGGLGPTEDDVTVRAIAIFLGKPLYFHRRTHAAISKRLEKHRIQMTPLIDRQCTIPKGCMVLQNENGTAPALFCQFRFRNRKKYLAVLPGPPREMQPIFTKKILPLLVRNARLKKEFFRVRILKIAGALESEIAEKVTDLLRLKPPATVGIYASPGEVELKIMAKSSSKSKTYRMLHRIEKEIRRRLGRKIYGCDQETLSSVVGDLLRNRGQKLSMAESCTGGLAAHLVTETPGCSEYFQGGVVAYSNRVKTALLFIRRRLLAQYGAVSAAVAKKMAENTRIFFQTDFAVSITGIAGPTGGSSGKPMGLTFIAIARKSSVKCWRKQFFGSRQEIQAKSANMALDLLRLELQGDLEN